MKIIMADKDKGRLEPSAAYIYERVDGVTYARKLGDPPDQRFEIGRDFDPRTSDHIMDSKLWGEIHRAAKTNPALQDAIDRVKLIHALSKQDETIPHHPV
jgi:hypothetical protein